MAIKAYGYWGYAKFPSSGYGLWGTHNPGPYEHRRQMFHGCPNYPPLHNTRPKAPPIKLLEGDPEGGNTDGVVGEPINVGIDSSLEHTSKPETYTLLSRADSCPGLFQEGSCQGASLT